MAVTLRAGPRADSVQVDQAAGPGLGNVQPLDARAAGAIVEWIDLLARIGHDLRTPLNAVIGFSDAMQNELFGPLGNARYQEYARHIRKSGDQLLRAAEDTLAMTALLAAPRNVRLTDLSLASVVRLALAEVADEAAAVPASIAMEIGEDLEVRADARVLGRAVRHLLAAGLSRAAPGACVRIGAEARDGRVEVVLTVSEITTEALAWSRTIDPREIGLGREDLSLWLARMLLDYIDSPLETGIEGRGWRLGTVLEETRQPDFFALRQAAR